MYNPVYEWKWYKHVLNYTHQVLQNSGILVSHSLVRILTNSDRTEFWWFKHPSLSVQEGCPRYMCMVFAKCNYSMFHLQKTSNTWLFGCVGSLMLAETEQIFRRGFVPYSLFSFWEPLTFVWATHMKFILPLQYHRNRCKDAETSLPQFPVLLVAGTSTASLLQRLQ